MIYTIRGIKVMLDSDLAHLYDVETKMLNRAVKRNMERFPEFFMFQLTDAECEVLRCQFGTAKFSQKRRFNPYAFTEHGILMLSSVLNSSKAVQVNIQIMMAFIQMRRYTVSQPGNIEQIEELRKLLLLYIENNDKRVSDVIDALNKLLPAPPPKSKPIGFRMD
jgi:phage regulator Rha-like protein